MKRKKNVHGTIYSIVKSGNTIFLPYRRTHISTSSLNLLSEEAGAVSAQLGEEEAQ